MNTQLYMLDTNTVSYFISGRSLAARRAYLEAAPHATVTLSVITEAEIRFGLEKRPEATRLRANFERFSEAIQILPWDRSAARTYGKVRADLNRMGKTLATIDLLIAAHAIAADAVLVTSDRAFLQLTPFLTVVDWATDL